MSQQPPPSSFTVAVRAPWHRFLEEAEPLRPELYRYCRYLSRSPWDAEDLVQETLARAFVTLGCISQEVTHPRAWLFRVASNLWFNQTRRSREVPESNAMGTAEGTTSGDARTTREAVGTLITRLAPQERAAIVLKDVFDFSLEEVAETLSTTVGAVKAALHRGRGKLVDAPPEETATPAPQVLDAFVDAFNARDLDRLTSLLLDSVVLEFPGMNVEYGAEAARKGSLAGVLYGNPIGEHSGIAPKFRGTLRPEPPRLELRVHRGEPLLLGWFAHQDGDAVRAISRVVVEGDRVSQLRTYLHQPEVLAEICKELGVPFRSNGHRHWW